MEIEDGFDTFIREHSVEAKMIKSKILKYFKILNLIEFVIDVDKKYAEELFLEFWHRFNIIYNQINVNAEVIDDVEIYFDNRIGIVAPKEYETKDKKRVWAEPNNDYDLDKKYRYNILKVIEKRNQEEEAIEELIADFEKKITHFFEFIQTDDLGKRLIAKIKDTGLTFSQEEINHDFSRLYRKFTIKNKDLGEFFIRETKDILNQLCDDFEKYLIESL